MCRLGSDGHCMGGDTDYTKSLEQSLGEVPPCESNGIEVLQRIFKSHLDTQLDRDLPWSDKSVLTRGKTMGKHALVPETGCEGLPWQSGQVSKSGDSQPAKGVDHLLPPHRLSQCPQIEPRKESDRVGDHLGLTCYRGCRGPSGGKRAIGDADQSFVANFTADKTLEFFGHSLCQSLLASIEADSPLHRNEQQAGRHHLDPWHQFLYGLDHRLEPPGFVADIADHHRCEWCKCLCLATGHPQRYTCGNNLFGCPGYPIIDNQYRLIRQRALPVQRPHRKPGAQRPCLHLPPRSAGEYPPRPCLTPPVRDAVSPTSHVPYLRLPR